MKSCLQSGTSPSVPFYGHLKQRHYTTPHWRLQAVPSSHTLLVRPPYAIVAWQLCSRKVHWALVWISTPQGIHWCSSQQTLQMCASVFLAPACRRKHWPGLWISSPPQHWHCSSPAQSSTLASSELLSPMCQDRGNEEMILLCQVAMGTQAPAARQDMEG